jgi:hypothetical protein
MLAVYDYIKTTWPFWNRKGGADHLQVAHILSRAQAASHHQHSEKENTLQKS